MRRHDVHDYLLIGAMIGMGLLPSLGSCEVRVSIRSGASGADTITNDSTRALAAPRNLWRALNQVRPPPHTWSERRMTTKNDAQQVDGVADHAATTLGPWEWRFSGTMGRWVLVSTATGEQVGVGGPPDTPLSPDQVLIASAPVLMDALRGAEAMLTCIASMPDGSVASHVPTAHNSMMRISRPLDDIRSAIAAAEGRSSHA